MAGTKASKNETTFKPGQSGNPNGRAKNKDSIKNIFEEYGKKKYDGKRTYFEAVVDVLYTNAIKKGDVNAAKYITDRNLGKIPETVNANVEGTLNISIVKFGKDSKE